MHKQRRYGTLHWVERWPARLMERYFQSRAPLDLYAFLGAVSGLTGELPRDGEIDWRSGVPDFERLNSYFSTASQNDKQPLKTFGFWRLNRNINL
jgi:hypothetical protein